ncbi:hypothetical protein GOODEAATRI_015131, partial [Goodea atripinnis]
FISAGFAAFVEERRMKHLITALHHPQANGGVERFNQTLKTGLLWMISPCHQNAAMHSASLQSHAAHDNRLPSSSSNARMSASALPESTRPSSIRRGPSSSILLG